MPESCARVLSLPRWREPCLFQWLPRNARVVVESHPGNDFTGTGSSGQCNRLQNNHLQFGAGGGTRTHTAFYSPRILSPVRLPFRHTGSLCFYGRCCYVEWVKLEHTSTVPRAVEGMQVLKWPNPLL